MSYLGPVRPRLRVTLQGELAEVLRRRGDRVLLTDADGLEWWMKIAPFREAAEPISCRLNDGGPCLAMTLRTCRCREGV
jgi:hypothetical protein